MKKNKSWFKARGYIHFDLPISKKNAEIIASNPIKVAQHSFYPFISYKNITNKIHIDKNKNKIIKKNKERPICYSSHADSAIYSYYSDIISKKYEKLLKKFHLDRTVIAFRSLGKSNIDFAYDVFTEIKDRKSCSVVCLDISGFFDNIDHSNLKKMWTNILGTNNLPEDHYAVFKSISKFSEVNRNNLYVALGIAKNNPKLDRKRICSASDFRKIVRGNKLITKNTKDFGIPQGSPISAMLSNIYMLEFDKTIKDYMSSIGGSYYRYCDDMIFISDHKFKNSIIKLAELEIDKLNLSINNNKTEIADFNFSNGKQNSNRPLQYLGFTYDGEKILIRSPALSKFSARMKGGVKLAKMTRNKYNIIRMKSGLSPNELYKRKIYDRYSHLGKQNFITYGYRASEKMESKHIRKQLKPLWGRLQDEIKK